jgi:hypothetical protein
MILNIVRGDGKQDTRVRDTWGRSWYLEDIHPAEVREIGSKLKVWELRSDTDVECNAWQVDDAIWQVECVITMGDGQIATARGQIEEAGCEETLSDREVAVMDINRRELLAERAREIDDPWNAVGARDMSEWNPYFKLPAPDLQEVPK